MQQDELSLLLNEALRALYQRDLGMIERDANERAITGRLAHYLDDRFPAYDVTAEYNRHGVDPKEVELPNGDGLLTMVRVFPDIIVHQLGDDIDNLLVIEAKKSSNPATDEADIRKLAAIKERMNYQHAIFLRLPVGQGAQAGDVEIRWV